MRRFLFLSVAGHGALVLLIFLTATFLSRPKTGVYSVDLLSSLPSGHVAAPIPVEAPQTAPTPVPAPVPKPAEKAPPKEALKIPDKKKKTPPQKVKATPKPTTTAKPAKAQPKPAPPSDEPLTPIDDGKGGLGGAGIVAEAGPSFPYPWYMKAIADKLDSHWKPENFQPDTTCRIRFVIHRDGQVTDSTVEKASGDSVFDQAASRAILYASPLPPLPGGYPEERLQVHMTFSGKGS